LYVYGQQEYVVIKYVEDDFCCKKYLWMAGHCCK
jgi:hypothetical protein